MTAIAARFRLIAPAIATRWSRSRRSDRDRGEVIAISTRWSWSQEDDRDRGAILVWATTIYKVKRFFPNAVSALRRFLVTDGQNTRNQIMRCSLSKRAWSNCVVYIPFILSGTPTKCWLRTCDSCVITTWTLGLGAPLVTCNKSYKLFTFMFCKLLSHYTYFSFLFSATKEHLYWKLWAGTVGEYSI